MVFDKNRQNVPGIIENKGQLYSGVLNNNIVCMCFFFRPRSSRVPRNLSIEHRTPAVQLVRNFQHRNKTEATYTSAIANRPGVRFFVLTLRAGDVLRPSLPVALSDCTDAVVMSQLARKGTLRDRD